MKKKIMIIGGGVAGLSAGIYALKAGFEATIYEKHFKTGGNLTGWNRCGYHIDNCIHWLTGTNPLSKFYKMWVELGALGSVEVFQPEALYVFEKDGKRLSLNKNIDILRKEMLEISPEDKKEIDSFIKAVKAIIHLDGISSRDLGRKSTLWEKIKYTPSLIKYIPLSVQSFSKRFKSSFLGEFFKALMDSSFSSLALIVVFATFCGQNGGIPAGSSSAMADRMTERFLSLGGKLRLSEPVEKINIEGKRAQSITLSDSREESGDYYIISGDPAAAFGKLLDEKYMPKALMKQYSDPKMNRFSSHHAAFACYESELPFKNDLIFEIPEEYKSELCNDYIILREFSHESSFSPPNKNIIQTMIYCDEDDAIDFIKLRQDREEYRKRKERIVRIEETIITEKFPKLKGKLKCIDSWTPASYKRYVSSEIGSYMSFILPPATPQTYVKGGISGVENLFLATQWQCAPGGLPIAASAGMKAIGEIIKADKKQKKYRHKGMKNMKPTVYFTSEISPEKVLKMYCLLNKTLSGNIAIKLHSGEVGNQNFLSADFWRPVIDHIGGTVVECNTAYDGERNTTEKHLRTIGLHGWNKYFKVDLMDAEGPDLVIDIPNGKRIKKNYVGKNLINYDSMVVLSHFKGHPMGGFGGALKQLSIGIASSYGKAYIHGAGEVEKIWTADHDLFLESMADAASSIIGHFGGRILYVNVMKNMSVDCDCCAVAEDPCMKDIGILVSEDPVAIDQACLDLVYSSNDPGKSALIERIESRNGVLTIECASSLGIGSREYELVTVD